MIGTNGSLRSLAFDGEVLIEASRPVAFEALFTGSVGKPSWEDLKALGPVRFVTDQESERGATAPLELVRDFGDSSVCCATGSGATASILPIHKPSARQHTPGAMSFAFTQQWARLGHACVHGAMLRVDGKGVLVVGSRAAGKSVISASALAADGEIVSDDYLLVGVRANELLGERIRRFISLRSSWAADALMGQVVDDWTLDRSGGRVFLRIATDDDRFPEFSRIDRIWVLKRPRAGRRSHSSLESISQAEVYAALVSAIQPLLLGADFPRERNKLQALLGKLMSGVPAARIETGQDIVLEPKRTWDRLLAWSP